MRPPLGFLVEGHGEFHCLPLLVRRGIWGTHGDIPTARARGAGDLIANLERHLDNLTEFGHPVSLVAALDSRDAQVELRLSDCLSARALLQERTERWLASRAGISRLHPLPSTVTIVLQHPEFESWLAADIEGLLVLFESANGTRPQLSVAAAADESFGECVELLRRLVPGGYRKRGREVELVVKHLQPARMALRSRSFRKFWSVVSDAYTRWADATGGTYGMV